MIDTAIFLGAGASKAEGAPLQGELFRDYFSSDLFKNSHDEMDRELATFFSEMFQIDVDNGDISTVRFPTFEEVLGLTDLAIMRKEAFRHFDIENRATNSGRLRFISQYLVFLVARVLDAKLQGRAELHRTLVSALRKANDLRKVVFVSTNYDILIDNALDDEYKHDIDLDYGVDFRNFDRPDDWTRPRRNRSVSLFKPHGSLNWLSRNSTETLVCLCGNGALSRVVLGIVGCRMACRLSIWVPVSTLQPCASKTRFPWRRSKGGELSWLR